MGRIRALDGLRGVAVAAVLASHALRWAHGGFLGVDVFFVLSGYLITSLLLAERERTGRIDLVAFYRRRAARLAPAYLLMLALATPLMVGPLHAAVLIPVWQAVGSTAVYGANWVGVVNIDALGPIMHTWSLSVEEQFYVGWPVTFLLLLRGGRSLRRWLGAAVGVVVAARAAGWLLHPGPWPYVATFTHSDGLLAGCLVAVLLAGRSGDDVLLARRSGDDVRLARRSGDDVRPAPRPRPLRPLPPAVVGTALAVLGGLALTLSVDDPATYLVGLTAAVAASAVVLRHLLAAPGRLARALGWGPLAGLGRISYGVYLYHLPIFQLVQLHRLGFAPTLGLEVGLTLAAALASWHGVEQPVQRWVARRWPRRAVQPRPAAPEPHVVAAAAAGGWS